MFSARRAVRGQGETERDTDRAKNRMNSAAIFHSRLQSLPTERSRGSVGNRMLVRHPGLTRLAGC